MFSRPPHIGKERTFQQQACRETKEGKKREVSEAPGSWEEERKQEEDTPQDVKIREKIRIFIKTNLSKIKDENDPKLQGPREQTTVRTILASFRSHDFKEQLKIENKNMWARICESASLG